MYKSINLNYGIGVYSCNSFLGDFHFYMQETHLFYSIQKIERQIIKFPRYQTISTHVKLPQVSEHKCTNLFLAVFEQGMKTPPTGYHPQTSQSRAQSSNIQPYRLPSHVLNHIPFLYIFVFYFYFVGALKKIRQLPRESIA